MMTRSLILTIVVSLAGCASDPFGYNPRSMSNMDAATISRELAKGICADAWKPTTYSSSKDSQETVAGNRANNRARSAFCRE